MDIYSRQLNFKDIGEVNLLEKEANMEKILDFTFDVSNILKSENLYDYCYGVFKDDKLIGFCSLVKTYQDGIYTLSNVYINKSYRNKGYGSFLLNYMFNKLHNIEQINYYKIIIEAVCPTYLFPFYEKYGFIIKYKNENECFLSLSYKK